MKKYNEVGLVDTLCYGNQYKREFRSLADNCFVYLTLLPSLGILIPSFSSSIAGTCGSGKLSHSCMTPYHQAIGDRRCPVIESELEYLSFPKTFYSTCKRLTNNRYLFTIKQYVLNNED